MNLPHKTLLNVFEVGDTGMESMTRFHYAFVKVPGGQKGYVEIDDLEWNCDDIISHNADLMEIDGSLLKGVWKQSITDRLYIEFSDNNLFSGKLTGGCDSGGCHDYPISGEWKINRNLIYFRPLEFIPKYPANVKIYFLSNKKVLYPVDSDHAFRYDYDNSEYLSGLKKMK
ncbi:hypothetical protein EHR02_12880 [Leptospira levettii]|uniref:hypothetical protein n=1 Tax=Leptospira levettii TaxID=2023178 RepID=UPI0010832019|nr:hypothetical protein [Leptospira levettii]TGM93614.1 hypothetical protein EHR02_12880 [Leptospira levettii]